eukprot:GILJ01005020.1.p1 GENE.GILJ01005020.1~~GILJ01005020.1.p1  ORF type:complete len:743 (-),score=180.16 GILJ01005020.1:145-2373(-)
MLPLLNQQDSLSPKAVNKQQQDTNTTGSPSNRSSKLSDWFTKGGNKSTKSAHTSPEKSLSPEKIMSVYLSPANASKQKRQNLILTPAFASLLPPQLASPSPVKSASISKPIADDVTSNKESFEALAADVQSLQRDPVWLEACKTEGVAPEDLIYKPLEAYESNDGTEMQKFRFTMYERRRRELLRLVCEACERLLTVDPNGSRMERSTDSTNPRSGLQLAQQLIDKELSAVESARRKEEKWVLKLARQKLQEKEERERMIQRQEETERRHNESVQSNTQHNRSVHDLIRDRVSQRGDKLRQQEMHSKELGRAILSRELEAERRTKQREEERKAALKAHIEETEERRRHHQDEVDRKARELEYLRTKQIEEEAKKEEMRLEKWRQEQERKRQSAGNHYLEKVQERRKQVAATQEEQELKRLQEFEDRMQVHATRRQAALQRLAAERSAISQRESQRQERSAQAMEAQKKEEEEKYKLWQQKEEAIAARRQQAQERLHMEQAKRQEAERIRAEISEANKTRLKRKEEHGRRRLTERWNQVEARTAALLQLRHDVMKARVEVDRKAALLKDDFTEAMSVLDPGFEHSVNRSTQRSLGLSKASSVAFMNNIRQFLQTTEEESETASHQMSKSSSTPMLNEKKQKRKKKKHASSQLSALLSSYSPQRKLANLTLSSASASGIPPSSASPFAINAWHDNPNDAAGTSPQSHQDLISQESTPELKGEGEQQNEPIQVPALQTAGSGEPL